MRFVCPARVRSSSCSPSRRTPHSSESCAGFEEGKNPAALALEWGVRRLGEQLELRTRSGHSKPVVADFFPAYDSDGGLLVALAPR